MGEIGNEMKRFSPGEQKTARTVCFLPYSPSGAQRSGAVPHFQTTVPEDIIIVMKIKKSILEYSSWMCL